MTIKDNKRIVIIKWNEATEQWRMIDFLTNKAIQEFFDCEKFNSMFYEANKEHPTTYEITVRKL